MLFPPAPAARAVTRRRPVFTRGIVIAAGLMLTGGLAACSSSGGHSAAASASGPTASASSGGTASGGTASSPSATAGASSASAHPGKSIAGLITFAGVFDSHGASAQHASFKAFPGVTSPASSCARIGARGTPAGKGAKQQFQIPAPAIGDNVYFAARIVPYHGPGTYVKASILAVGASITVGNASFDPLAPGASVAATVRADGSGTFTFANAAGAKSGEPTLSGSVSWTCSG